MRNESQPKEWGMSPNPRNEPQHQEWALCGTEAKQTAVRMVQAHSCGPDVAPITLWAKHCAKFEVETLTDLEGRGIFPPGYLILERIQGEYSSASPCHLRFRHPSPGILWALNPIFVAVFNYYSKGLESRGESVSVVFFSSDFLLVIKWCQVWIISVSKHLSQPWICPYFNKLWPVPVNWFFKLNNLPNPMD